MQWCAGLDVSFEHVLWFRITAYKNPDFRRIFVRGNPGFLFFLLKALTLTLRHGLYYFQIKMHQDAPRIFHSG